MAVIKTIQAREVLDSRGNPTIEVDVIANDAWGRAMVPSGASTGIYEAAELRDNDKGYFFGKGVKKAVSNVNKIIASKLKGMDADDQRLIDQTMIDLDGTLNKKKLGANAILGVSMAASRCAAMSNDLDLYQYLSKIAKTKMSIPVPFANILNGGVHAGNDLAFQEFMIAPIKAKTFFGAAQMISETYHALKLILSKKYGKNSTNVGDEGGFAPPLKKPQEALDLIASAIKTQGYDDKLKIAMDAAASEFYHDKIYDLGYAKLNSSKLSAHYLDMIKKYDIISIEDPFDQDDFKSWQRLNDAAKIQIVGDDLLVTNPDRIKLAEKNKLCNSLLLKVNQIGTLTQAIDAAKLANKYGWTVMVSHRSGETEDPFIADLSVALGFGQIKIGAPARTDRTSKYNQLIRIEQDNKKIKYSQWR